MEDIIIKLKEILAIYGLRVIAAFAILLTGIIVAKIIRAIIRKMLKKSRADETLILFASSVSYITVLSFVIIASIGQLGVQTASFVAVLGAAGLAIGLALQGSLANFAAGVLMVLFKPFKVGDYIEGGGAAGTVEEISIFSTVLKTPDNKKIIVPNARIIGDKIVNYTAKDTRRVDIIAGVSYKDDIEKVKKVLTEIIAGDDRILQEPAPTIGVIELAQSSINFAIRSWVKTPDYWNVYFSLNENIKKRFDAEGISIPFPQQDVHLYKKE